MDLNKLAILLIGLGPENLEGLDDLKKEIRAAIAGTQGRQKKLLSDALDTAEAMSGHDPETCQIGLDRIDELLEQAMENPRPASKRARSKISETMPETTDRSGSFIMPQELDAELLSEFVAENLEYVSQAESALLEWEKNPGNQELLNTIFRAFHTIKGTASFVNLDQIKDMAHQVESMLAKVRDRQAEYSAKDADLALKALDVLKHILIRLKTAFPGQPVMLPDQYEPVMAALKSLENAGQTAPAAASPAVLAFQPGFKEWLAQNNETATEGQSWGSAKISDEQADSTIRLRTDRLDKLIDMVGELVIAHSMESQDPVVSQLENHDLAKKVAHTGKIVRELQELSMTMRMVPLKATFQRMARVVRDLAVKGGKAVRFVTEGDDTEIDRNMVDTISEPLLHMLRNAIDHGIEPAVLRRTAGKKESGMVRLRAYHSGSNVVIEVDDDGRGLDRQAILAKALEKGLASGGENLQESEVFALIFRPGFSTAEQVTEVSGRGVGMDVVKRGVESLKGRIEVRSEPGRGSTFSLQLPLTMAITDGMLVRVGSERFIIPTNAINITLRASHDNYFTTAGRGEMVNHHGEMVPLYRIHRIFRIEGAGEDPLKASLVLIGADRRKTAFMVDEILGQLQVVEKSLGRDLSSIPGIAAGAILGDGRVGLILDMPAMIKLAQEGSSLE
ncbi:chemotaxis protein CheA [candidate division TA06 bacterium]|nr:chemotaxis protein CheA [candidate division TA06 bacterium]